MIDKEADTKNKLYGYLSSSQYVNAIEAAKSLFVKSFNPIYFYIILQCCKKISYNLDYLPLVDANEYECLSFYLAASYNIYQDDIINAKFNFSNALKVKQYPGKLPLYVLNREKNTIRFNYGIFRPKFAAQTNLNIINELSELKRHRKIHIKHFSVDDLKVMEEYYSISKDSGLIPISILKRIRTEVMPNGYALNKFWIVPKDKNNEPIEIEFSARATTQKSFLLLTMAVRQNKVLEKKLFDDEIFLYHEKYEKYYKEALSRCGINVQSYLDDNGHLNFKATKEWWSPEGVKTRKIHVHRVNEKARGENIKGALLVKTLNPEDKAGYMLAENLGALISLK